MTKVNGKVVKVAVVAVVLYVLYRLATAKQAAAVPAATVPANSLAGALTAATGLVTGIKGLFTSTPSALPALPVDTFYGPTSPAPAAVDYSAGI